MAMYLATHAAHTTAACVSTTIASLLSVKLSALQDTIQAWCLLLQLQLGCYGACILRKHTAYSS